MLGVNYYLVLKQPFCDFRFGMSVEKSYTKDVGKNRICGSIIYTSAVRTVMRARCVMSCRVVSCRSSLYTSTAVFVYDTVDQIPQQQL